MDSIARQNEKMLKTLDIEVSEITQQYRSSYESVFKMDYDSSSKVLDALGASLIDQALLDARLSQETPVGKIATLESISALYKLCGRSTTKRRLLISIALGRVYLRNILRLARAGDLESAISALSAASMTSGVVQTCTDEIVAKAAPGKVSSSKRNATFKKLSEEALKKWRAEVPHKLSASRAAEKLRAMGIPLSHDKLARLISAEKRANPVDDQDPSAE